MRPVAVAVAAAAIVAASVLGGFAPLEQALRSARFTATDRPPSGDVVFVEIDAGSLAEIGVWPWPRTVHAQVLDRLVALGASDVVFDIDFSTASTEQADAALEAALARAGGYAFLAAFQQLAPDGSVVLNQPLARFAAEASPVLVNVDGDGTGLLQSLPAGLAEPPIPALARALVPGAPATGPRILVDFGIDLAGVERIPVSHILDGSADPAAISGRQVVVGASAVELRDFFRVPRFGVIPGPMVQIAATETLKTGRVLRDLGPAPALIAAALAAAAVFLSRRPVSQLFAGAIGVSVAGELAAWLALAWGGCLVDTVPLHLAGMAVVMGALLVDWATRRAENQRQQARLAWLARHDAASGARSRQALLDDLAIEDEPRAVMLVELDRLDTVVATLGHDVADRVVAEAVTRLREAAGQLPARIGSNVLALDSEGLDPAALARLLEAPYAVGGHRVMLQTRFGLGLPSGTGSAERLRQAEVALGMARLTGSRVSAYDEDHARRIEKRRVLDLELRRALEEQQFFLLFQPQVDLATGAMIGVEALVRWQHPELGLVSPGDFVPLAEETGLIVELGDWVLREALRQAAAWSWTGRLSVNVSAAQFRLADMVGSVREAVEESGFPASRLDIEITESLFVDTDEPVVPALEALRGLGIGIALDDFGTGYSSLSYLTRLPIDKIKIDQSFVRALPDPEREVIIETVLAMAQRLGKTVIAEGIETGEQSRYLATAGCPVGQGYLFGRPSTAQALGLLAPAASAA